MKCLYNQDRFKDTLDYCNGNLVIDCLDLIDSLNPEIQLSQYKMHCEYCSRLYTKTVGSDVVRPDLR